MKLIAFYLPQFHPIPENDTWWGKGFTEWTNVTSAKPLFEGHYQPRLPADLGFYDLRLNSVARDQAAMAKEYGIRGFCYYYYWFDGKKLLDLPLNNMLKDKSIDLPFCLCYANENWTRRWDGLENEILMKQSAGAENDRRFINDVLPHMRDERYITVNGKPLLLIYRAQLFPDISRTTQIWREEARKAGFQDLYLCKCETFSDTSDPLKSGFDANVEFPPHNNVFMGSDDSVDTEYKKKILSYTGEPFNGHVYSYKDAAYNFMNRPTPEFTRFNTAMLGWDNTARKRFSANIFKDFDISFYEQWLSKLIRGSIVQHDDEQKRIVFINAWNEWAEGTYLEPDRRYGHDCLRATKRALESASMAGELMRKMKGATPDELRALEALLDSKDRELEMLKERISYITDPNNKYIAYNLGKRILNTARLVIRKLLGR